MIKVCVKCNIEKPFDSFSKHRTMADGLQQKCKACVNEYNHGYYQRNKDKIKESAAKWVSDNRERSRVIKKKWAENNPDKQYIAVKRWNTENKEHLRQRRRAWYEANKELVRTYCVNRRLKLSEGSLSLNIVDTLLQSQQGNCAGCGRPLNGDYHIDHIFPISKGGPNIDSNVQLLHSRCNMFKSDKYPWDVDYSVIAP